MTCIDHRLLPEVLTKRPILLTYIVPPYLAFPFSIIIKTLGICLNIRGLPNNIRLRLMGHRLWIPDITWNITKELWINMVQSCSILSPNRMFPAPHTSLRFSTVHWFIWVRPPNESQYLSSVGNSFQARLKRIENREFRHARPSVHQTGSMSFKCGQADAH